MVPCKGKRGWYLVGEDGMPVRQNGKIKVFDGHREDPTLAEFSLIGLRQRLYGHAMVIGAFYRWVIQQVGKERFVREIWFQRPTAEWWERWEKTPQGQDWIQWYDKIRRQGPKISQLPD